MQYALIKKALMLTIKRINEARQSLPEDVVNYFKRTKSTFLSELQPQSLEMKKLALICYDRLIIDFLIYNGKQFKITDISIEEDELGSSVGGSLFISGAMDALKQNDTELLSIYLMLSIFVFNPENTDRDTIIQIREKLVNAIDIKINKIAPISTDNFYSVKGTRAPQIKLFALSLSIIATIVSIIQIIHYRYLIIEGFGA